jgi:hypothetical protein
MSTYFKDQGKRSENAELEQELASNDKNKKRDAVKKVIRDMTLGKDVSGLFSAVVNNMMTPNLEVRKLVYLYLINYAKTQPDLAIMAVNGFVKDARYVVPPVRAPRRSSVFVHAHPSSASTGANLFCFPCENPRPLRAFVVHGPDCCADEHTLAQRPEPAHPRSGCAHHGVHPR